MAIVLPGGFDIRNNEPADARISLADQTARLGLSAANVYEGLVVYQRDNDTLYVLTNASDPSVSGNWSEVGAGTGTGNITGSGATNQVTYFTGATSVTGSSGFTFDGSNVVVTGDISASTYTGSLVSAGDINFPYGLDVTGSLNVVNGQISASFYTGSFSGDGSQVTGVVSASYAVTASHALNGGGGGGVTINNNVDTYLVTATGTADTLDGESKLTFDGTTFNVDGAFTANTKSFLIDHQSQLGKKLIYGVLEGPEHAVYLRGRLTNDDTITFPEEWSWLVDKDSITVQLTPIGSHQQLWVEQVTETSITVNSNTDIDCYYLIHATRKDVDPLQTVE